MMPNTPARFPVPHVLHSRSKEDKRKRSQVEVSVISLERILEASGVLLLTSEYLEGWPQATPRCKVEGPVPPEVEDRAGA